MTFEEKRKAINDLRNMAIPEYSPLYSSINLAIEAIANYDSVKTELEPCADAVSRQAVLEVIEKCHCEEWVKADIGAPIEALQPVTPAEKVGRWKRISMDKYSEHAKYWYRCDRCGEDNLGNTNYCPHCGAKMQEVEE